MPALSNITTSNNVTAVAIKQELGYANTAAYLDMNGAVRYLNPGTGKTINSTPNSAIAFTDLSGAYLRDFEAYSNSAYDFNAIGVDSTSNIIVASNLSGSPSSIQVTKLNATGNVVWSKSLANSSVGIQVGGKIVCDWADNIYLRILCGNNTSCNASLISLNANGSVRWNAQEDMGFSKNSNTGVTYGNSLGFVDINMTQIRLGESNTIKVYNSNTGTVNNYYTSTLDAAGVLDTYDILCVHRAAGATMHGGTGLLSGTRYPFIKNGDGNFVRLSGTDIQPYCNDVLTVYEGYYAGSTTGTSPSPGGEADILLTSVAPPYPTNPKSLATTSKISLIVHTRSRAASHNYAWTLDYGSTRKVIGYKFLPVSNFVPSNAYTNERYYLIVGYISGGYTSSIFVTAYYSYSGGNINLPASYQTFPWSYEIGSSDSSHDYEIVGPPSSYIFPTKTKVVIPVRVSRGGTLIRRGVLSLSLPQIPTPNPVYSITDTSQLLSITNEGSFPGVSVYPLKPTITLVKPITVLATSITTNTITGPQNTSNSVFVGADASFTIDGFNFTN